MQVIPEGAGPVKTTAAFAFACFGASWSWLGAISAVHNLPPHTVNDYGLGIATMSVRREATNVDLRGVPNQGATSERFSSRSVADRLLDLRPGQLKHHAGAPTSREATQRSQADSASNARRPGAPTSAARRLASFWQARGDSAT